MNNQDNFSNVQNITYNNVIKSNSSLSSFTKTFNPSEEEEDKNYDYVEKTFPEFIRVYITNKSEKFKSYINLIKTVYNINNLEEIFNLLASINLNIPVKSFLQFSSNNKEIIQKYADKNNISNNRKYRNNKNKKNWDKLTEEQKKEYHKNI